ACRDGKKSPSHPTETSDISFQDLGFLRSQHHPHSKLRSQPASPEGYVAVGQNVTRPLGGSPSRNQEDLSVVAQNIDWYGTNRAGFAARHLQYIAVRQP